jgi:hypothetical protein
LVFRSFGLVSVSARSRLSNRSALSTAAVVGVA